MRYKLIVIFGNLASLFILAPFQFVSNLFATIGYLLFYVVLDFIEYIGTHSLDKDNTRNYNILFETIWLSFIVNIYKSILEIVELKNV